MSTSPRPNSTHNGLPIVVVGGGAAGLLAAGRAARRGYTVTIVERNQRPARKLMITGKGRCNVTNNCSVQECVAQVPGNGRFLYSAFSAFSPADTMALLEECGVPLKTERGNRVFPQSDKAVDVVDALVRYAKEAGARFCTGRVTALTIDDGVCTGVMLENGKQLEAYAVIVCTGGCSYPGTGSTGDGYLLAQQAGHTVVEPRPSLVPLTVAETWCAELQGLSLKNAALTVENSQTGKTVYTDFGEMLFTHFGVSGPMILSASAHMREMESARYRLHIDLKPALMVEQVDARLVREFEQQKNTILGNALTAVVPRSLVPVMLLLSGLPGDRKCHSVTREERHRLCTALKDIPLTVTGFRPIAEAIVTAGGVSTRELSAATMESKLVSGLYFAGEVIDVDAYTGGFNLQIAFSTGVAAGDHV